MNDINTQDRTPFNYTAGTAPLTERKALMIQPELFTDTDCIDETIVQARKNMRKAGWREDWVLLDLFERRLIVTGQENYIPYLRWQWEIITGKENANE